MSGRDLAFRNTKDPGGCAVTNPYLPEMATIEKIEQETPTIKTFYIKRDGGNFDYNPGQFCIIGLPGVGDCSISIGNTPTKREHLELTIMKVGAVTEKLHGMKVGDRVTLRGPYGNGFPKDALKGMNISYMAGGVGFSAISNMLTYSLDKKSDYGKIEILYGAKTPADQVFKNKIFEWAKVKDVEVKRSCDKGDSTWKEDVGVVGQYYDPNFKNRSKLLFEIDPGFKNTAVVISGPPVMIKFTLIGLDKIGFPKDKVFASLEARMNCGCGKCGRCNVGHNYVCQDGPVFTSAQIAAMPAAF